MEIPLLKEVVIVLGISIVIILAFQRLKLPSLLGFLLAGIIVGPSAFNLLSSQHEVELLSEIGIIFLLFVIGIELSFKGLISIWRTVFIGGGLQVGLTILVTALLAMAVDVPINTAVFLGFLISLSSTAIVLKILNDRGELKTPHGRLALGILIFQDIIVVPMMLVTPILAGEAENVTQTVLFLLLKLAVVGIVVFILQKYIAPFVFELVVKSKNRELFILSVIVFCFGVAWMTSAAGLSLALGAFFAGLIISESEYSHQATANVLPFREIFISFFFVSVGSLLDLNFFVANFVYIVGFVVLVLLVKMLIIGLVSTFMKQLPATSFKTSFSLFQVGEFSLLLSTVGVSTGILPQETYQYFLAVSIISMGLTPFVMLNSEKLTSYFVQLPIPRPVKERLKARRDIHKVQNEEHEIEDHLVIIGYGLNGKNIARVAQTLDIPYLIVEFDYNAFNEAKEANHPVVFGDAGEPEILHHIHVQKARVVVIAISDTSSTKQIVQNIRQFSNTAYIIVRTRYVKEIEENMRLGADEVIPEEFETSIEIFTRVLKQYLVTESKIFEIVKSLRSSNYEMLTSVKPLNKDKSFQQFNIPNKEIASLHVQHSNNNIVGKPLAESEVATTYRVNVLAIKRGNKYISSVTSQTIIEIDDIVYIFGSAKEIKNFDRAIKI